MNATREPDAGARLLVDQAQAERRQLSSASSMSLTW